MSSYSNYLAGAALALICMAGCLQAMQMVGGLNEELPADAEITKVVHSVHQDFERMAHRQFRTIEPIAYRKQVVAGANYFIKAIATDNEGRRSHVHLRIYKPFKGTPLELSAIRTDQDQHKPLEYFD